MNMWQHCTAALMCGLFIAGQANSSTIASFVTDTGFLDSYTLTDVGGSGVDIVATGFQGATQVRVDLDATDGNIQEVNDGIGIGIVGPFGTPGDDDIEPNGAESETLVFSFFSTGTSDVVSVTLESLTFDNVDSNDNFDLLVNGALLLDEQSLSGSNPYLAAPGTIGSVIAVRADGAAVNGNSDNFKVTEIRFEVIPEPTSLALLSSPLCISLLGGLWRRR